MEWRRNTLMDGSLSPSRETNEWNQFESLFSVFMLNIYNYVLCFAVLENNRPTTTKLRFDFSFEFDSTVTKAEFYVYVRPIAQPRLSRQMTMLLVHHLLPPKTNRRNNNNKVNRKTRLIQKQRLNLATGTGKWYHFDITRLVQNRIRNRRRNLALKVECTDFQGNPLAIIVPHDEQEELYVRNYKINLKFIRYLSISSELKINALERSFDQSFAETFCGGQCWRVKFWEKKTRHEGSTM